MDPSAMSRAPPPKMYSLFERRPAPTAPTAPAALVAARHGEEEANQLQSQPPPPTPLSRTMSIANGAPLSPTLQPSHQPNVAQKSSKIKAIKGPNEKLAKKGLNNERVKTSAPSRLAVPVGHDDDDDVLIVASSDSSSASASHSSNDDKITAPRSIFDRAGPSTAILPHSPPLALSRTPSASTSAVPVLVIPDSPPPKPTFTFQPLGEVCKAKRVQRKLNEPVEARWPNSEEHGHFFRLGTAHVPEHSFSRDRNSVERWSSSVPGIGEGKAIDRSSDAAYFDDFRASVCSEKLSPDSAVASPKHLQRPLAQVSSFVSYYPTHPLFDRITAPLRAVHPNRANFDRPGDGASSRPNAASAFHRKDNWTVKYAPQAANEVLGTISGSSAQKLKAWLQEVKVSEVRSGNNKRGRQIQRGFNIKKKRRRGYGGASDLEGFVASDDEEVDYEGLDCDDGDDDGSMEEPSPSSGWVSSLSNLILLAGPNGSGKTAAVHAVASELGWDVFEVYPGIGKRTAKDIEKLVGEVGRNHTVRAGGASSPRKPSATATGGLFSMFAKQTAKGEPTASSSRTDSAKPKGSSSTAASAESSTHQSLILFEEVDVLYRDEKDFWTGLAHLATTSRRPIILTCTDTSYIPFSELGLQTINTGGSASPEKWLPFAPPEPRFGASLLRLVALAEGHILTEASTTRLYLDSSPAPDLPDFVTNGYADPLPHPYPTDPRVETAAPIPDLRRSLMQLQFECQWAVGDPGGVSRMEVEEGKETRTNWSFSTLNENRDRIETSVVSINFEIIREVRGRLESYAIATEAQSFVDAFVSRRPAVALEDYDSLSLQLTSDEMLEGPTISSVTPQLPHQLASSGNLEHSISTSIDYMIACLTNGVAYPSNEALRTRRLSSVSDAASFLIPLAIVDAPAPILPSPRIFVDYLPFIRQITAHEDLLEALQGQDHVALMGRRSTRRSSRAAQRRPRRLGWNEEQVDSIRKGGFEGIEQDRRPEFQWEDEDDPIEDAAAASAAGEVQAELAAHSSQIS
ncbi:BQ2448_111 [Microbotryum intermedium]|uniref:BQ2448_111 protein n=1 Tax=Microbotryum intermedium TaxID=269621 RepID=A0A238F1J7_9BASI|nr:BQ2448_111 [Microbotryum intermedium]